MSLHFRIFKSCINVANSFLGDCCNVPICLSGHKGQLYCFYIRPEDTLPVMPKCMQPMNVSPSYDSLYRSAGSWM